MTTGRVLSTGGGGSCGRKTSARRRAPPEHISRARVCVIKSGSTPPPSPTRNRTLRTVGRGYCGGSSGGGGGVVTVAAYLQCTRAILQGGGRASGSWIFNTGIRCLLVTGIHGIYQSIENEGVKTYIIACTMITEVVKLFLNFEEIFYHIMNYKNPGRQSPVQSTRSRKAGTRRLRRLQATTWNIRYSNHVVRTGPSGRKTLRELVIYRKMSIFKSFKCTYRLDSTLSAAVRLQGIRLN